MKFHWAGDINKIMQAKKSKLPRESKIFISEDWPAEVDDRRKVLKPIFRRAFNTDHSARLIADKLYVDHKLYTIDTIESLPEDLNPTFTSTQYKGEYVAFWGQFSHFSTFHKQTFEIKKQQILHSRTSLSTPESFVLQRHPSCSAYSVGVGPCKM